MKKLTLTLFAFCHFFLCTWGSGQTVESKVYEWADLEVEELAIGETRNIIKGSTEGFEYFQVHSTSLQPGKSADDLHTHEDLEKLIIIKEGTVELTLRGESSILVAGSVTLALPGDLQRIRNAGLIPATYYLLQWRTKSPKGTPAVSVSSEKVNWFDIRFLPSEKGGRRNIIRRPSSMLAEFEMHTTTLNEGMKSHDPHTHIEAEIILVRYGQVEELIDGKPHKAGPGSVIFLESMVPHGIRNIGKGPCEYYAFKWKLP